MTVLEPDSLFLIVLLLGLAVGLIGLVLRYRRWFVAGPMILLTIVLAMSAGMAVVNDYYGYYQSWSQLNADFSGDVGPLDSTASAQRGTTQLGQGRLEYIPIAGPASHITRNALVYLPPQYFQPRFAHTRFPVVELIHGTPGTPSFWTVHLHAVQVLDRLMARHEGGPMVLVMPTMSVGTDFQECVNAPGALDDTYITQDVRTVIDKEFRVSPVGANWGIAGLSSGGYCAANLALRHPGFWGASGIMSGYFRPQDGPAAAALHNDPVAERANDPLLEATKLSSSASPLPAFWMSAGTADVGDLQTAQAFAKALHGVEQVTLYQQPGAGHTIYAWGAALPHLLAWMWPQISDPALRTQFPIAGPVTGGEIITPLGPRSHHHGRHSHGAATPSPGVSGERRSGSSAPSSPSVPTGARSSGSTASGTPSSGSRSSEPPKGSSSSARRSSAPTSSAPSGTPPRQSP